MNIVANHDTEHHWDAGEAGCGQLAVGLKRAVAPLAPGEVLRVTAHGAGAAADIPAWCRVTGHELIAECAPEYVLRKKRTRPDS